METPKKYTKEEAKEFIRKYNPPADLDSVDNDGDYQYYVVSKFKDKTIFFNIPWDIACEFEHSYGVPSIDIIDFVDSMVDYQI